MNEPKKPQRPQWPLPSGSGSQADTNDADAKRAGRVVHDARGNAVWDWKRSPTDSTTHLLRKLDSPELSLAEDAAAKPPPAEPARGLEPYQRTEKKKTSRKDASEQPAGAPASTATPEAPNESVLKQLLGKR